MRIVNNKLVNVLYAPSPNIGKTIKPTLLVMHYTGSSSMAGAVNWLRNPAAKASAHVVIGRNGEIQQLVPFNVKAWHAGVSRWQGVSDCNDYSIGIELVNAGLLTTRSDGTYAEALNGHAVAKSDVVLAAHAATPNVVRPWHAYTEKQLAAATAVASAICAEYGIKTIVGHSDIAPIRKVDPGPAFPMAKFIRGVFAGQ